MKIEKLFTALFSYDDQGNEVKRKSRDHCQGTLIDSKTLVTAASCATYEYYDFGGTGYKGNADLLVDDGWHAYEYKVCYQNEESFITTHLKIRSQLAITKESTGLQIKVTTVSKIRQLHTTLVKNRI